MPLEKSSNLRQPCDQDTDERKQCVCYVQAENNQGTGLLVKWNGENCIITNNHVLPRRTAALVLFNYRRDKSKADKRHTCPGNLFFCSPSFKECQCRSCRCRTVDYTSVDDGHVDARHLDYTLVGVDIEDVGIEPLSLWPEYYAREQIDWPFGQAFVVGHPDGTGRSSHTGDLSPVFRDDSSGSSSDFVGEHKAITEKGSSGSPVFFKVEGVPLLGLHYWANTRIGQFVRLPAIVTDLLRQELISRAGDGYDPDNSQHVEDALDIAESLSALQSQDEAMQRLNEIAPSGRREGLWKTTSNTSTGAMQLHGDPTRGGGLIELTSFTILPESDPWTPEDQKSFENKNAFHGNNKIGVIIYRTSDKQRQGEVIIGDFPKVNKVASDINTAHARSFKRVVGRLPKSGDICCGFAYNCGTRDNPDPKKQRKLVFGSLTFNLSGGHTNIEDAFHGTQGKGKGKYHGADSDKWASKEEKSLVRRVFDVYKRGPPYDEEVSALESSPLQVSLPGGSSNAAPSNALSPGGSVKPLAGVVAAAPVDITSTSATTPASTTIQQPQDKEKQRLAEIKRLEEEAAKAERQRLAEAQRQKLAAEAAEAEKQRLVAEAAEAERQRLAAEARMKDAKAEMERQRAEQERQRAELAAKAAAEKKEMERRIAEANMLAKAAKEMEERAAHEAAVVAAQLEIERKKHEAAAVAAQLQAERKEREEALAIAEERKKRRQPPSPLTPMDSAYSLYSQLHQLDLQTFGDDSSTASSSSTPKKPPHQQQEIIARHVSLHCSQDLKATYLPKDPSDPRYKGTRGVQASHANYTLGMHSDGAGAPFPLRTEVPGKAAWLDLSRAKGKEDVDWWFDFGPETVARVLEFEPDGRDWSVMNDAAEIRGVGQWKNTLRPLQIVSAAIQPGEGVWEVHTSSGWKPLTSNAEVLAKIEADYCNGRAHLEYGWAYRLECGCLARERTCHAWDGQDHGPEGTRSHMYYVDFAQMVEGPDGEQCFRQVDLWYTLDTRRQRPVRRRIRRVNVSDVGTHAPCPIATTSAATTPATFPHTASTHGALSISTDRAHRIKVGKEHQKATVETGVPVVEGEACELAPAGAFDPETLRDDDEEDLSDSDPETPHGYHAVAQHPSRETPEIRGDFDNAGYTSTDSDEGPTPKSYDIMPCQHESQEGECTRDDRAPGAFDPETLRDDDEEDLSDSDPETPHGYHAVAQHPSRETPEIRGDFDNAGYTSRDSEEGPTPKSYDIMPCQHEFQKGECTRDDPAADRNTDLKPPSLLKYSVQVIPGRDSKEGCNGMVKVVVVGKKGTLACEMAGSQCSKRAANPGVDVSSKDIGELAWVVISVVDFKHHDASTTRSSRLPQSLDVLSITVEPHEQPPVSVTFEVNSKIDLHGGHAELRVGASATKAMVAEEWEEATARVNGVEKRYWYSLERDKSLWTQPLKYYPVKFKNRPKAKSPIKSP